MDAQALEDSSDFPQDRIELITLLKAATSHALILSQKTVEAVQERNELLQMNIDEVKENSKLLQENADQKLEIMRLTEMSIKISQVYLAFLKSEVGVGLGCFVGGVLIGITLSIRA